MGGKKEGFGRYLNFTIVFTHIELDWLSWEGLKVGKGELAIILAALVYFLPDFLAERSIWLEIRVQGKGMYLIKDKVEGKLQFRQ